MKDFSDLKKFLQRKYDYYNRLYDEARKRDKLSELNLLTEFLHTLEIVGEEIYEADQCGKTETLP